MEKLCSRCARLSLRQTIVRHQTVNEYFNRSFSSNTKHSEESKAPSKPAEDHKPLNIIRQPVSGRPQQRSSQPQRTQEFRPPTGSQLLGRNGPRQGQGQGQGQFLRRTAGASQPGQVLRRSGGDPARAGQYNRRPGPPGAAGRSNDRNSNKRRRRPRDQSASQKESNYPTEAELDEYVAKYVDPPANPTQAIEYHPTPQSALDLQKDWPDTPLSATGLTATLIKKIEYLAHRLPHGYQTPEQIAEHFHKGNLTRFESEEEKQQVVKIAQQLAQQRAEKLSKRKGEQIAPLDMTFDDLSKHSKDKKVLVDDIVKGEIAEAEKQRMPFLDSIVRNLRNNETYSKTEMDKFMARVQSVMPAQGGNKRAAQKAN